LDDKTKEHREGVDDLREEVSKLREEIKHLSESIPSAGNKAPEHVTDRSLGQSIGDYVNDVVGSVMSGISSEIEKSVLVDPTGEWFDRHIERVQARSLNATEAEHAATLMGALASGYRLRILSELMYGGRYASEMESVLKDISPSTISNHLKTLQEAGLVVQEGDRGRYIVTLPGRIALKMATRLTRFLQRKKS
jgi:DNA-binding transcriptional ArsR family regulator